MADDNESQNPQRSTIFAPGVDRKDIVTKQDFDGDAGSMIDRYS